MVHERIIPLYILIPPCSLGQAVCVYTQGVCPRLTSPPRELTPCSDTEFRCHTEFLCHIAYNRIGILLLYHGQDNLLASWAWVYMLNNPQVYIWIYMYYLINLIVLLLGSCLWYRYYCFFQTGDTQITPIIANIGDFNVDNLALNYDEVWTIHALFNFTYYTRYLLLSEICVFLAKALTMYLVSFYVKSASHC